MYRKTCTQCQKLFDERKLTEGRCPECVAGGYTLPRDEWDEMTAEGRKAARAKGIRPETTTMPEDIRQQRMDESSQCEGPRG